MFGELTVPGPGESAARGLFSAALRRGLQELIRIQPAVGPVGAAWRGFVPALRRVAEQAPGALASAVRRPNVAVLIRCLRGRSDAGVQAELLATLALELAVAGALPGAVVVPQAPARVVCLGARRVLAPPAGVLTIAPEGWSAGGAGGTIEEFVGTGPNEHVCKDGYAALAGPIALALRWDNNPLADVEGHPDKEGSKLDLGGRTAEEWVAGLRAGLAIIGEHLPGLRAELDVGLSLVVPVGFDAERHLSASYAEAIGAIYLSLHPRALTLAEAIVHEFSHNKLYALLEHGALLENAWSPLYSSPLRPDPRPLHGVLLAVHAFLPVARMLESMLAAGTGEVEPRLRQVAVGNHAGAETLRRHARPTALGEGLLAELLRWDEYFKKWWED